MKLLIPCLTALSFIFCINIAQADENCFGVNSARCRQQNSNSKPAPSSKHYDCGGDEGLGGPCYTGNTNRKRPNAPRTSTTLTLGVDKEAAPIIESDEALMNYILEECGHKWVTARKRNKVLTLLQTPSVVQNTTQPAHVISQLKAGTPIKCRADEEGFERIYNVLQETLAP